MVDRAVIHGHAHSCHDKSPMPYGDDMKSKIYCVFQTALERWQTVIHENFDLLGK